MAGVCQILPNKPIENEPPPHYVPRGLHLRTKKIMQAFLRYIRFMIQNNGQRKIRTKSRAISININSF